MTHMQIIIGGETVFDEVIEGWMAPPKPDQIPAAIRAQLNPNAKPAPFLKAMMLAMIANALANGALRDPRLQPLDVDLKTRPTGWTISVDMPPPDDTSHVYVGSAAGETEIVNAEIVEDAP
ncbi:hypothetical protein [Mycobacterium palustre]|uniref:Uncharacterized protein n=1 Tax=Mycobacterium palustre TaxID=153971 RepID=A0A1X1ZC43_9MYCO|nr:hypothetical protein [Mycobacterium palustre]MCV7100068.1 hypothetical protein [Mycobacterium palustre]ORW20919.1 hypothetical protein AWC19_14240 [Mycobacterium palustre]